MAGIFNTNQIKKANTDAVRRVLRSGNGVTIAEIVQATHLSVPTVSRIIEEMVASGEVLNCPEEVATGGRRARQYRLNGAFRYILCVYFDRHQIWYNLCNAVGYSTEKGELPVEDYRHPELIDSLVRQMQQDYPALRAVSIGVPAWVINDELQVIHEYPDILIRLTLFHCTIAQGEPKLLEHEAARWLGREELDSVRWLPADLQILPEIEKNWPA